jgi:hypothetical protein
MTLHYGELLARSFDGWDNGNGNGKIRQGLEVGAGPRRAIVSIMWDM